MVTSASARPSSSSSAGLTAESTAIPRPMRVVAPLGPGAAGVPPFALPLLLSPLLGVPLLQAANANTITRQRIIASSFFIIFPPCFYYSVLQNQWYYAPKR